MAVMRALPLRNETPVFEAMVNVKALGDLTEKGTSTYRRRQMRNIQCSPVIVRDLPTCAFPGYVMENCIIDPRQG